MTLRDTGGIFRGMLWHQGEADSNTPVCAERYENNVIQLANRIRSEAFEDARGLGARGENAPVPFILGTMTRGADETRQFLAIQRRETTRGQRASQLAEHSRVQRYRLRGRFGAARPSRVDRHPASTLVRQATESWESLFRRAATCV